MTVSLAPLLWTLATLAVLVVAIEGAARLWLRFGARTYPWKPYTHFDITPDQKILPHLSPRTVFMANSLGLRGKEAPAAQNVFRIVACGGSAVECLSLDESEAWPALVEQHLSKPEVMQSLGVDAIHVLNFAKSGFTNEALGYLLPRVLDRVGPIDVLTITTGTSAANAWTKAGTPHYPRAPGLPWDDVDWHGEKKYGATFATCAITELVRRARQWRKRPAIALRNTGGALAAGRRARANATEIRTSTPSPEAWIADYEASLTTLVQLASRYARRVVLLRQSWFDAPHPTPEELSQFWHGFVGDSRPGDRKIFYDYATFSRLMAETDQANIRVASRLGIETVHLADAITPTLENYYDQIHYTPAGARRIADFVRAALLKMISVKPVATQLKSQPDQRPAA
jgi:lysophospholipase L1-like esterase